MQVFQQVVTVTTAGTPVAVTLPTGMLGQECCKIAFFPLTGSLYVGITSTFSHSTGVGLVSAAGGISSTDPPWFLEDQDGSNTIDPTAYWLDHSASGGKVSMVCWQR